MAWPVASDQLFLGGATNTNEARPSMTALHLGAGSASQDTEQKTNK